MALLNPRRLHINSSLLGIYHVPKQLIKPLCAVLNSTAAILSRLVCARILGVEGNIQLDVYSAKLMLAPVLGDSTPRPVLDRLTSCIDAILRREVLSFVPERRMREMAYRAAGREADLQKLSGLCELDMADRRELDDAVLEMMGESSPERRKELIDRLYAYLREFFEQVRQKEEKAIANKKRAKRRGPAKPSEIAAEILEEIREKDAYLLQRYDPGFLDPSKPYDTYELPSVGEPSHDQTLFAANGVAFRKGKKPVAMVETKNAAQDALIVLLARSGVRGLVRVPHDEAECRRVCDRYSDLVGRREMRVRELIQLRTADEDMQVKIYDILMPLLEREP
jgi:hypothetical protein